AVKEVLVRKLHITIRSYALADSRPPRPRARAHGAHLALSPRGPPHLAVGARLPVRRRGASPGQRSLLGPGRSSRTGARDVQQSLSSRIRAGASLTGGEPCGPRPARGRSSPPRSGARGQGTAPSSPYGPCAV